MNRELRLLYSEMRQNGGMGCEGQETAANNNKMLNFI